MTRRRLAPKVGSSRFPTGAIVRVLAGIVIVVLVCTGVLVGAGAFFTYRIVTEYNDVENVTPSSFLLTNYESLNFLDSQGVEHAGWLLRGLRGAPVVVLCHGYDSNRSELLSLATVLQENHFNVYVFNFAGVEGSHRLNDLGTRNIQVLKAAMRTVMQQPGINPVRAGVFGRTTGGYAALAVAEQTPAVRAIVADTIYEHPRQMLDSQIEQLIGSTPLFRVIMNAEFHLLNLEAHPPDIRANLSKLQGVPKFFLSGRDNPSLAAATEKLYELAPEPKRLLVMDRSTLAFSSGNEKKEYEAQVLTFFLKNLPLHAN
jgi:esterase/lipase